MLSLGMEKPENEWPQWSTKQGLELIGLNKCGPPRPLSRGCRMPIVTEAETWSIASIVHAEQHQP